MKCILKVKLEDGECNALDRACVRETARQGQVINRSDLVRAWIAAGCTLAGDQLTGMQEVPAGVSAEQVKRAWDAAVSEGEWRKIFADAPKVVDGMNIPAVGWRGLAVGEVIEEGDEFYHPVKNAWLPAKNLIGEKVESNTTFRRKLPVPASACAKAGMPAPVSEKAGGAEAPAAPGAGGAL